MRDKVNTYLDTQNASRKIRKFSNFALRNALNELRNSSKGSTLVKLHELLLGGSNSFNK